MFSEYHAHIYFDQETYVQAENLCLEAEKLFPIKRGRFHKKNVGPHPCWSCQLAFEASEFPTLIPWLNFHRKGLNVLIHPVTDDDLKDHQDYTMWLGQSFTLDLSIFTRKR
ncbi:MULTISPECIES: DOPA 4,5-dioxygenase family protein [unclassified Neptuniibacter]|uniref:DOPA 4,5-dioxygenase family protein n=1 Tax=unclassified Neptuniibacter TaxID=2630693 RepID=UPI0025EFA3EF|nr:MULTISPECIES: DOPA 4,5-dioxygenase family protein [unclassified Neptuniibacter]